MRGSPLFQLSYGRRRFILKVLDARELHGGLKELHSSLHSLEEQIRNIARDVEGITSLEDSFRGEGAAAIQAFFRECHSPFLLFFEGFLTDYQNTLKRIACSLQMLEPASNGFIRQSFLDGEAAQGLVKTESITRSLTEETNTVMQKVSDIVSLPHLQDGEFSAQVRRAELHRRNTVDDLMTFDGQQTLALDPIEQDLHLMQTYIDEISSLFQSGNLSVSGYSVKQLHSSPIYGELLEGIRHKAGNSMRSTEFFKELGVTALGQILPPGAFSIWAIWQSTYERKTIQYQLRALKALAELNSNEISPEEFTSLSGREILTVEVIDEHGIGSQNQGGKFHLYEDGRIVREYYAEKGTAYEFVDSIPEDRVGGVRELDSMADGTPLEILEYLSLTAVVRKQGTKVIRKSINKADFDALVRILKEEKGHVVLPWNGKGTDKYNTGTMKHIYHGEINKRGKAVGYHHESMMGGNIIPGTEKAPDKNGVYMAKVEIDGVRKVADSSFFPKEWNRVEVLKAIDEAFQTKQQIGSNKYRGVTSSGIKVEMYLNKDGSIATAYPLYKK